MERTYKKIKVGEIKNTQANQEVLKQLILNKPKESMQNVLDSVDTKIMRPKFQ